MLVLKNVNKIYKSKKGTNTQALYNINLEIEDKGLIFVVGKSGSGKSTFLNIVGGLDKYNSGEIIVDNKSFNKFKNKDYDYYRNSYVGFVFQEFNLIEEYNVYQNIELALTLQNKKVNKDSIEHILKDVGLDGIGKRKVNELSGGQKQRVSIARALIKNPNIILADEPTGSLDKNTSSQIFDLLKEISKEELVIIVSHDIEFANKYADRIIEFSDGKIVNDTGVIKENVLQKNYKSVKSKMPFIPCFRLASKNLFKKKIRLIFTILLITCALVFFGMSKLLSTYNIPYSHAQTMIDENEQMVSINKNYKQDDNSYQATSKIYEAFSDEDIQMIENKISENTIKVNSIFEDGKEINFDIPTKIDTQTPAYYTSILSNIQFVELNNAKEGKLELLGRFPEQYDEIVISKYLADYIMYNGIYLYSENNNKDNKLPELYKPTSYDQLLNDRKYIKLGSTKVTIVGIVNEDLSKYNHLKEISYNTVSKVEENLLNDFVNRFGKEINKIYVKSGFINNISLLPNLSVDNEDFLFSYVVNNETRPINSGVYKLNKQIKIYNNSKIYNIEKLNDNEIIINKEFLNYISDDDFEKKLTKYLSDNIDSGLSDNELTDKFIIDYLNTNNIINSNVTLSITDYYKKVNSEIETKIPNLKIVGYTNSENIYIADNILNNYMHPKYEINKLYFFEDNFSKLEDIFTKIPVNYNEFTTETAFSDNIITVVEILDTIANIAFYASIVFFVFSMVLFVNFIIVAISYSKKQIGILRALGARKLDIFKIFFIEALIIGLISLMLSLIICYFGTIIGNNLFTNKMLFSIRPIIFTPDIIYTLGIYVLCVVIISTILPIGKISNMKPIDAILDK